jgi:type II secretory pathway predicted ATPase ExeA
MPAAELFALLSDELGAAPSGNNADGVSTALLRLRDRLAEFVTRGERPLIVVDEAHLIDDLATFEALKAALNFATLGPTDLRLVLVASPELLLRLPPGLADRLSARCQLAPLTRSEAESYIHGRLAAAGAAQPLFSAEASRLLYRASGGLPRRLNHLADLALLVAYAQGLTRPDNSCVVAATQEFESDPLAA